MSDMRDLRLPWDYADAPISAPARAYIGNAAAVRKYLGKTVT
jgi:hypothetical protein